MLDFIFQTAMVVGAGAVVYLLARTLPRIGNVEVGPGEEGAVPHWLMERVEKIDEELTFLFEKLIRRVRLALSKLDNVLGDRLKRFKRELPKEPGLSAGENQKPREGNGNGR